MVMTSGLPLVMVRGSFANLNKMDVSDLEAFIPFMTKCSIYRAGAETVKNMPVWWMPHLLYQHPLQKPKFLNMKGYKNCLVSLVCRCYCYHKQLFLIQLSAQISKSPESVIMKDNGDNSTSLFSADNLLHILTFDNENKQYDANREVSNSRKSLLPTKVKVITDVYLCENCDAEFNAESAIRAHELQCYRKNEEVIEVVPETQDLLRYLKLGNSPPPPPSPLPYVSATTISKNRNVEFSSLLGQRLLQNGHKRDKMLFPRNAVEQYEAYCRVPLKTFREGREKHKGRRSLRKVVQTTSKEYCFTSRQRRERYKTLRAGLNKESRYLLRHRCKPCHVVLNRIKVSNTKSLPDIKCKASTSKESEEVVVLKPCSVKVSPLANVEGVKTNRGTSERNEITTVSSSRSPLDPMTNIKISNVQTLTVNFQIMQSANASPSTSISSSCGKFQIMQSANASPSTSISSSCGKFPMSNDSANPLTRSAYTTFRKSKESKKLTIVIDLCSSDDD